MARPPLFLCVAATFLCFVPNFVAAGQSTSAAQGTFEGSTDIGSTQAGSTVYDDATHSYRVNGSGADIWGKADGFRLSWVRLSGNATLTADVHVALPSTHPFAKGVLMFRQSLDPDSAYADIAIHADGHITLQYREITGGPTKDTVLPQHGSPRLRIQRTGDRYTVYALTGNGEGGTPSSITVPMRNPVYVGVGVCSHDASALQTVMFSNVTIHGSEGAAR